MTGIYCSFILFFNSILAYEKRTRFFDETGKDIISKEGFWDGISMQFGMEMGECECEIEVKIIMKLGMDLRNKLCIH